MRWQIQNYMPYPKSSWNNEENRLIKAGHTVADISAMSGGSIPELVENTVAAMTEGADIIYQACMP